MSLHLENSTNEANDLLQKQQIRNWKGAKLNSYLIIYIEFSTVYIVKQQTLRKGLLDNVDEHTCLDQ